MSSLHYRDEDEFWEDLDDCREFFEGRGAPGTSQKVQLIEEIQAHSDGPRDDNGKVNDEIIVKLLDQLRIEKLRVQRLKDESSE